MEKSVKPTAEMSADRICAWCGKSYLPELVEYGEGAFRVRVPKFAKYCADCGPNVEQWQQEKDQILNARLVEEKRKQLSDQDPEDVLRSRGFFDAELSGKHLGTFIRKTALLEERWQVARDYAAGNLRETSLFFYGFPGRGKTHLARGIARSLIQQGEEIRYWKLGDIIAKCKALMNGGGETPDQYIAWICRFPGLAIIDELGRSAGKGWDIDSVVFPLLDRRQDLPTVWISNYPPKYLGEHYDEAVQSRLCSSKKIRHLAFPEDMDDFRLIGS